MSKNKERKTSRSKTPLVIAINLAFIVFGIAGLASGTMAWFDSQKILQTEVGSFSIVAPPSVEFDLYYLDHFTVVVDEVTQERYGNYNKYDATHGKFAGYETSYENAVFQKVNYVDGNVTNNPNPTNITDLWPAHKLTFAITITSGVATSFDLESWDEVTNPDVKITKNDVDIPISLSWAIDMYGKAYSVLDEEGDGITATEIAAKYGEATTGYRAIFADLTDQFSYDEDLRAEPPHERVPIVTTIPENEEDCFTVIFFTIEFSNADTTWYEQSGEYYSKTAGGNSNCYELLALTDLLFALKD